jgi:hypothetical protein
MVKNDRRRLSHQEVEGLLASLRRASSREECRSCECLQGFIAQLELDAGDDARPLLEEWRADPVRVHKGLGCEPCAPAEVFAEYLMRKREM